jgi:hypothetical protein
MTSGVISTETELEICSLAQSGIGRPGPNLEITPYWGCRDREDSERHDGVDADT